MTCGKNILVCLLVLSFLFINGCSSNRETKASSTKQDTVEYANQKREELNQILQVLHLQKEIKKQMAENFQDYWVVLKYDNVNYTALLTRLIEQAKDTKNISILAKSETKLSESLYVNFYDNLVVISDSLIELGDIYHPLYGQYDYDQLKKQADKGRPIENQIDSKIETMTATINVELKNLDK